MLQFISEPVAALLAYDARPEAKTTDKIVVVADLGGTRSDIAVFAARGGMYSILATAHDFEVAGGQLDQVLIDHFAKEFMKKKKSDPRENPRGLAKLKLEAEATKKALSLGGNATLSVESLSDGLDFTSTINRTRYELLASKVFGGFTRLIEGAIKKADLDILNVDEVCEVSTLLIPHSLTQSRSSFLAVHPIPRRFPDFSNLSSHQQQRFSLHPPLLSLSTHLTSPPVAPPFKLP